jgi:hypothetical protein
MTATDLRYIVIEARTCLICADSTSCSDSDACRRDAADYIEKANRMVREQEILVDTPRLGKGIAVTVTELAGIRIQLPNGDIKLIDADEVLR